VPSTSDFIFRIGKDFYPVFAKHLIRQVLGGHKKAEMERQVIDAPVEEGTAAGEGFFQRPDAGVDCIR